MFYNSSSNNPVLIVGAGPTGLTAAILLKRLGINCRIIDKKIDPVKYSKALAIQPRTLEIFNELNVLDIMIEQGKKIYELNLYENKIKKISINFNNLNSQFPFILSLPQYLTEYYLKIELESLGVEIERGIELIDLQYLNIANKSQAKVKLRSSKLDSQYKSEIEMVYDWVLACDGAHSSIRHLLKLDFNGNALHRHFVLADFITDEGVSVSIEGVHGFLSSQGPLALIPMRHAIRMITEVAKDASYLEDNHQINIKYLHELIKQRSNFNLKIKQILWNSNFNIEQRILNKYVYNNCVFFLGDAAHVHSPVGGQGMNTGIQDAYNLAWKLGFYINKQIKLNLLTTYSDERQPVAASLLQKTKIVTKLISWRFGLFTWIRQVLFKLLSFYPGYLSKISEKIAELDIRYKKNYLNLDFTDNDFYGSRMYSTIVEYNNDLSQLYEVINKNKFYLLIYVDKFNLQEDLVKLKQKTLDIFEIILIANKKIELHDFKYELIIDHENNIAKYYGFIDNGLILLRPDKYILYVADNADFNKVATIYDKIHY